MTTTARYLTTEDMAERTGTTADYWQRLLKAKRIPGVKLGTSWRVAEADFEAFMRGGQKLAARPGRQTARQARRSLADSG
jgi:excisionase family DNA binding protein